MTTPLRPRTAADLLAPFAKLLEAEWYNGNMREDAYERLNADLQGIRIAIEAEAAPDLRAVRDIVDVWERSANDTESGLGSAEAMSMIRAALAAPAADGLRQVQAREQSAVGAPHAEPYKADREGEADGLDVGIGPRIGVRLRDAFWRDSGHYDHLHEHGVMVTHKIGNYEWCREQLIGQNYPCPDPAEAYQAMQTKTVEPSREPGEEG